MGDAVGPALRGEEDRGHAHAAGASHVHLRLADVRGVRYRDGGGRNAALDVLGPDGSPVLSVTFRRTNPGRAEAFDAARLDAVRARFGRLGEGTP